MALQERIIYGAGREEVLVATANQQTLGLYYCFAEKRYSMFNSDGLPVVVEDGQVSGYGYPKAPQGRWSWLAGAWERICGKPVPEPAAPTLTVDEAVKARTFKDPVAGKVVQIKEQTCEECGTPLRPLPHYHEIGPRPPFKRVCCHCLVDIGGFVVCPLEERNA